MTTVVYRLRDGRFARAGDGVATPSPAFRTMPEHRLYTNSATDNCEARSAAAIHGEWQTRMAGMDCFAFGSQ